MDPRLHVAARKGDVGALQELLQEDPLALSKAALAISSSDSPLHIAAMLGHTDFAKLVISRNPELSRELNQQGYSPIHVASIKGHLQIVTELLNFDKGLCFLRDCEGRTPLHCAAIKGRVEVITHLMRCCPESAMEVTFEGETLLHLVVNNSQTEVMMLLISSLRERNLLHKLIDCCDEDGNTALQLAIARNHKQMTKMLSKETENHEDEITEQQAVLKDMDRNNQNQKHEITADETNIQAVIEIDRNQNQVTQTLSRETENGDEMLLINRLKTLHNPIIVLCSLLATCCFDAIISPPVRQTRPSNDVIHEENIKNISAHQRFFLNDNTTLTDLLARTSLALHPDMFLQFVLTDATCFVASLVTIYLVTVAVYLEKTGYLLAIPTVVMLHVVIGSAFSLYQTIIDMTSDAGAKVSLISLVIIMSTPFLIIFPYLIISASLFMKHRWPKISSRLASCYSRLRVHISDRCEKMIAKVLQTQHVTK